MVIRRVTVSEATTDALRRLIVTGELAVGTPLRQDELARRLGVSRTPLREAINRLATEGLVRSDSHRGAIVTKPSLAEAREVYEIRVALETLAARLAAELVSRDAGAILGEILDRIDLATSDDQWARLNTEFHMTMYELSGRQQLCNWIATLRNRSELYVQMFVTVPGHSIEAQSQHWGILEALEARDADAVGERVAAHLESTLQQLTDNSHLGVQQRSDELPVRGLI